MRTARATRVTASKVIITLAGALALGAWLSACSVEGLFFAFSLTKADLTEDKPTEGNVAYHLMDFPFDSGLASEGEAIKMLEHLGATTTASTWYYGAGGEAEFPTGYRINISVGRDPGLKDYEIRIFEPDAYDDEVVFYFRKE